MYRSISLGLKMANGISKDLTRWRHRQKIRDAFECQARTVLLLENPFWSTWVLFCLSKMYYIFVNYGLILGYPFFIQIYSLSLATVKSYFCLLNGGARKMLLLGHWKSYRALKKCQLYDFIHFSMVGTQLQNILD